MHNKSNTWIIVIVLTFLVTLATNATYLTYVLHTPKSTINLGVTHYWEDYMYYVSQFSQGAHGNWLNHSLFTEETIAPTLLHFPNILLGKIGGLFHLSPMDSYQISCIILLCLFLLLSFYCMKKLFKKSTYALPAFLFFTFSASLMNRLPETAPEPFYPFQLWNTPHYMFDRFTQLPHYFVMNMCFLVVLLFLFGKAKNTWFAIGTGVCMLSMTILQPIVATLTLGTAILTASIQKEHSLWKNIGIISIGYFVGIAALIRLYMTNSYVQTMTSEAGWQVLTTLPFLLKSIGPILPFAIVGIIAKLKKAAAIERFGMILLVGSYTTFLIPEIPRFLKFSNARLLFSAQYLFWGWFAAIGLFTLAQYIGRCVVVKKQIIISVLFFLFFSSVTPTIIWEIQHRLPDTAIYQNELYFLPKTTASAFTYLDKQVPYQDIVLANSDSHMNMLVPVLSGHKTMLGPAYATINASMKGKEIHAFFTLTMDEETARQWVRAHHISYILYTVTDGYAGSFAQHYPFLEKVFSSDTATVYKVK